MAYRSRLIISLAVAVLAAHPAYSQDTGFAPFIQAAPPLPTAPTSTDLLPVVRGQHTYKYPGSIITGVAGPGSSVNGDIAFFDGITGALLKDIGWNDNGSQLTAPTDRSIALSGTGAFLADHLTGNTGLIIGDPTNGGYQPNNPAIPLAGLVSATGAKNGFVGQIINDVPFTTTPFLAVGVTGFGKVPAGVASVVYGLYGLCEIYNAFGDCIGGEVTARNFSGVAASTGLPPPTGSPTTNLTANGWQITCGSQSGGESDCSTGLYVSNENGGSSVADPSWGGAGIFVNAYRNYGMYIAQGYPTGAQNTARLDNNGNGFNLILATTQTMTAANAVIEIVDKFANPQAAIRQNGDGLFNNLVLSNSIYLTPNDSFVAIVSPGASALSFGPDAGWTTERIGNGTATIFLDGVVKFGTFTGTPGANDGYITIQDSSGATRKVMTCTC